MGRGDLTNPGRVEMYEKMSRLKRIQGGGPRAESAMRSSFIKSYTP